ncbi:Sugar kinase of the NBD/HSP70 family, may contain an N-terminal HTH domain [Lentzea fradiae]|uniref:Sugar kinase of the NBD/HSP70 family, may contain an N-terminal HTH domain n=1 Tax=Lentzea fradiae TaxID=200378 RepID=A0A1G7VFS6_9PSEU|nr:ROK family protein [Lentzea fradiae]SDG58431.1 Sugar kinase of the NBD/HSP70 family, may contain an N-terminal HTH domain [Lentzea fradiae]
MTTVDHLRQVRLGNLRTVLLALVDRPGSRADLAARTGLTKATLSNLTEPLLANGILVEDPATGAGMGRPSKPLRFHPDGPVAVGAEVNVSHLAVEILGLDGETLRRHIVPADIRKSSADEVLDRVSDLIREHAGPRTLLGAGLAVPGVVHDGVLVRAPNLPNLVGVPLAQRLGERLGIEVELDNEANLAALAHLWPRHLAGEDFVHVSADVGIGAGVVLHGEVYRGTSGFAGELGHVVIEREGEPCTCGSRGCVERYAGLDVILREAGRRRLDSLQKALGAGDARAVGAVRQAGQALGVGLATLMNLFDVPTVVLGGSYAVLHEHLSEAILSEMDTRVLAGGERHTHLVPSPLGEFAVVRGAAGLVTRRAVHQPERLVG